MTASRTPTAPADTDASMGIPDFMSPGMVNARLGILHLFSTMTWDENFFSFVTRGVVDFTGQGNGQRAVRTTDVSKWLLDREPESSDPVRADASERLAVHLETLALKLAETIAERLPKAPGTQFTAEDVLAMWDSVPGGFKFICRYLAKRALQQFPVLSDAVGLIGGLVKATSAGLDRYSAYANGRGVVILPGVPTSTVDGIKRAMDLNLASGTYDVLKSAGGLALTGLSAGTVSTVVNVAFSVVEALVLLSWRAHDYFYLATFREEARAHWAARNGNTPFHARPTAFNDWYRPMALRVPVVPCLTLLSGVCGDKMRLLRMFDKEGEVITQARFDAGVKHLDRLKGWGTKYLSDVGYRFGSEDPALAKLIAVK
ncbi:hypothetical protein [Luteibacter yeojuensis]|uniref:Uncharacterized protein n=1 Tax=Luteibacter yeojuensis TaxID=345309 RepID=A0A7X5QR10_9GAMM|nr:hypothetical protein [Luteibacter yeojuensis]NID13858.1 hypothetical protein [Luteibacter yeojuensis]